MKLRGHCSVLRSNLIWLTLKRLTPTAWEERKQQGWEIRKLWESACILKVEPIGFHDRVDDWCERKRSQSLGPKQLEGWNWHQPTCRGWWGDIRSLLLHMDMKYQLAITICLYIKLRLFRLSNYILEDTVIILILQNRNCRTSLKWSNPVSNKTRN